MEILLSLGTALIGALVAGFFVHLRDQQKIKTLADQFHQMELEKVMLEERGKLLLKYEEELAEKHSKIEDLSEQISLFREKEAAFESQIEERERSLKEKLQILENAKEELTKQFAQISHGVLEKNNRIFLDLALQSFENYQKQASTELHQRHQTIGESFKILQDSLQKLEEHNQSLEQRRIAAYSGLTEQVRGLMDTQTKLQTETRNLVNALRAPSQRGRWGEIQLRRVVEMAGMIEYCDFEEQVSKNTEEGKLRPDLIVRLPNSKNIVVDSKVALDAYLDAISLTDEDAKQARLMDHARQVRRHVSQLSAKAYWQQFEPTPEFVVMFLPGEPIFTAALEYDAQLIEYGAENRVLIATPMTLIALLRAVAYGWRQEQVAESAQEISKMAQELYGRMGTMADHFGKLGANIDRTVKTYNDTVGSMERMVLPQIRKLKEKGIGSSSDILVLEPVDRAIRELQSSEVNMV